MNNNTRSTEQRAPSQHGLPSTAASAPDSASASASSTASPSSPLGSSAGASGTLNTVSVTRWMLLLVAGMAVEFLLRFLSYAGNPLGVYVEPAGVLAGLMPILVGAWGIYQLQRGGAVHAQQTTEAGPATQATVGARSLARRSAALTILLGGVMLVCFFIFQMCMPRIF